MTEREPQLTNPTGIKFPSEFKFRHIAKINYCHWNFQNISMIAYIIGNQNLSIFNSVNLTILSQIANLNPVNIFMQ